MADFEGIKNELKSWNWREEFAERSMESCWKTFNDKMNSLVSTYVPETTIKSRNQPVWMNARLLRTIRKKRSLWARYIKYRSEYTLEKYYECAKETKNMIKSAKKRFENKPAKDGQKNPGAFFKYINRKKNTRDTVGPLKVDDKIVETDEDVATELNKYFVSVFTSEQADTIPSESVLRANITRMNKFTIETKDVRQSMEKIKKYSTG